MQIDGLQGDILKLIEEVGNIGKLMFDKGWAEGSGGNFSILLSKNSEENKEFPIEEVINKYKLNMPFPNINGRYFLVKGSGKRMRDIKNNPKDNLCIGYVDDSFFHIVWPRDIINIPTSEITAHLAIQDYNLKNRPELIVVLHAHPTELIIASFRKYIKSSNRLTDVLNQQGPNIPIFFPEGLGYLKYYIPGSKEIALETLELTKDYRLMVWEMHGVICSGKTISECFDLIDIANKAAKIWRKTSNPDLFKYVSEKQIEELKEHYQKNSSLE